MAAVVRSAGFVVKRRVLVGSCHVWAAGSPVRTVMLRWARETVGLRGEAAVEMGEEEETHGSKLGEQWSSSTGKRKLRLRGEDLGGAGAAGMRKGDRQWLVLWWL